MKVGLIGYGKMGHGIHAQLKNHELSFIVEPNYKDDVIPCFAKIQDVDKELIKNTDVFVEFTVPNVSKTNIEAIYSLKPNAKVICGTTGWNANEVHSNVKAGNGSFMYSTNYSIGVNVLAEVLPRFCAPLFQAGCFDASMVELHHKHKLDSPSGTAKTLATAIESTGFKVPISDVRSGYFPGTHSVYFDAQYETIEITHTARDRFVFCAGVALSVNWIYKQSQSGIYTFKNVISELISGGN
jgi:4-hydroxy-tetrahydrodipicolinate reductase